LRPRVAALEVHARAEAAALAGQHDHLGVGVARQLVQDVEHLLGQRAVDGVQALRPGQGDGQYPVPAVELDPAQRSQELSCWMSGPICSPTFRYTVSGSPALMAAQLSRTSSTVSVSFCP